MDEGLSDEPLFDRKEIARTVRFLNAESDKPDHADIALDFGGRFDDSAYIAADLFRRGVVQYVLVSGGNNQVTHANEGDTHARILMAEGVPADRIIVENEASNTYENALLSLKKLRERLDPATIHSVIAVTKWYHARRALMTLKRNWPQGIRYFTETYEPRGVPKLDWYLHKFFTERVLNELEVIPEYLEQDHIAEIEMEDGAWV